MQVPSSLRRHFFSGVHFLARSSMEWLPRCRSIFARSSDRVHECEVTHSQSLRCQKCLLRMLDPRVNNEGYECGSHWMLAIAFAFFFFIAMVRQLRASLNERDQLIVVT